MVVACGSSLIFHSQALTERLGHSCWRGRDEGPSPSLPPRLLVGRSGGEEAASPNHPNYLWREAGGRGVVGILPSSLPNTTLPTPIYIIPTSGRTGERTGELGRDGQAVEKKGRRKGKGLGWHGESLV